MSWDLSRTSASEMPEKEEKGRKAEPERRRMGWWMRHIVQYIFKKRDIFFFLPPSCLWSDYPLQSTVDQLHWKRIPLHTLCYLLRLFAPPWEREKGKESGKEGCILKCWSSHSGKRKTEGNPPVTFFISFKSAGWVMRITGLLLVLRGLTWMFFVCMCTVGMLWVSDLLGAGAAVMESLVP